MSITIINKDRFIGAKYIVATYANQDNCYIGKFSASDYQHAVRMANTVSKIYKMPLVVIRMP